MTKLGKIKTLMDIEKRKKFLMNGLNDSDR